jgi:superfamily II DNA or RNA helicase
MSEGITDIGVIQRNHPMTNPNAQVQVASVQTLLNRKHIPMAQYVLIDECHRWFEFYGRWMKDPLWRKTKWIGMSATPWTKGLGKHFEALVRPTTAQELIDTINPRTGRSFLAKPRFLCPDEPDLSGVAMVGDDYNKGQLARAVNKVPPVANIVKTWTQKGEDRATMCFAVNRAHARTLWEQFKAAGVPVAYVDGEVAYLGNDEVPTSRKIVQDMSERGEIKVVVNIGVLTTGCDWPWISCIILARPTKSKMLYTQIIGRGLRVFVGKADCIVLDHSGSTTRLNAVEWIGDRLVFNIDTHQEELCDGKHRVNAKREKEEPTAKICPSCHALKPPRTAKCPSCGFVARVQNQVEVQDGELVELGQKLKKQKASKEDKQRWYSMLLGYAYQRGHNPGWAFHKYREKFGVKPSNQVRKIALAPDEQVLNWITSRNIAWAKSRGRAA